MEIGEYSVDEFVSYYLKELLLFYWKVKIGCENLMVNQVVDLLVLRSKWEDEEVYDFILLGDVIDYVICIKYGENG